MFKTPLTDAQRFAQCWEQAARIVALRRAAMPAGFDPLNLTVTVTPGKVFSDTEDWTAAKFNQLGQPTFAISGSLANSELANGAVHDVNALPGAWWYATSTSGAGVLVQDGTATTRKYTLVWGTNTPPAAFTDGLEIAFKADVSCDGTVSLDMGTGAVAGQEKALKKHTGQSLVSLDILAGQIVVCRYGSASGQWQMLSQLGARPVEYLTATGTDTYVVTPAPAYTALSQLTGRRFAVQFTNANTTAPSLNVNGLGALSIKKNKDQSLVAGDIKAGQIHEVICDNASPQVFQMQSSPGVAPSDSAIVATSSNLRIKNGTAGKLTITADEIVLRSGTVNYRTPAVSLTLDMTTPGPPAVNGLDLAYVGNNWYYIWIIYNGTTVASIASLSATNPALPAGYSGAYKAMVGAAYATSAATWAVMSQRGREVMITNATIFGAAALTTSPQDLLTISGAYFTAFVQNIPPIAVAVTGTFGGPAGSYSSMAICPASDGSGAISVTAPIAGTYASTGINNFSNCAPFRMMLDTYTMYAYSGHAGPINRLEVAGYSI